MAHYQPHHSHQSGGSGGGNSNAANILQRPNPNPHHHSVATATSQSRPSFSVRGGQQEEMLYQYENSWPAQHYHHYQGYQGHSYYSYDQAATGCTVVGNQYYGQQQQQGCKTTYQFDGHQQRSPASGGSTSTSYQGYSAGLITNAVLFCWLSVNDH